MLDCRRQTKENVVLVQAPIHSLFLLIKTRKGYPLEKSFYFIEKKLTKVKWETPKEENAVFVIFYNEIKN